MDLGTVKIEKSGRHAFKIKPIMKAKAAVMDVREVKLIPVASP
jgi:hypothetical protein